MLKRYRFLALILVFALTMSVASLVSPLQAEDRPDRYDDEEPFIATYAADPTYISPLGDVSAETKRVVRNMHEGLYQVNPDGTLSEGVASSITFEHEAPYLTADIQLKEGITFHNGDPLNAEAVKYSIERLSGLVEGITSEDVTGAGYWGSLMNPAVDEESDEEPKQGSIEILDDYHLKVTMLDDYGVLTTMYSMADALLVPPSVSEDEQKAHPVGLGPYQFVEYQEGNYLSMTRFEDYYGDKPEVKNVEFHKYADIATLPIAFESGEIDMLGLARETYDRYAEQDLYIHEGYSNDVRALYFNLRDDSIFNNMDLRLAFQYGIDKEKMNATLTNGRGSVLYTHMTPFLSMYYNDELEGYYEYDLDKAKAHLESAGYAAGDLSLTLKTVAESTLEQDMAVLIQEDLALLGIEITIDSVPWTTYYEEVYRGHNYELAILNMVGYPDPSRILSRYMTTASGNLAGIELPEIDELLAEASQTTDQEGLAVENYKKVQAILAEEAYNVFLLDPGVQTVLSADYAGYENYPFAFTNISKVTYR